MSKKIWKPCSSWLSQKRNFKFVLFPPQETNSAPLNYQCSSYKHSSQLSPLWYPFDLIIGYIKETFVLPLEHFAQTRYLCNLHWNSRSQEGRNKKHKKCSFCPRSNKFRRPSFCGLFLRQGSKISVIHLCEKGRTSVVISLQKGRSSCDSSLWKREPNSLCILMFADTFVRADLVSWWEVELVMHADQLSIILTLVSLLLDWFYKWRIAGFLTFYPLWVFPG